MTKRSKGSILKGATVLSRTQAVSVASPRPKHIPNVLKDPSSLDSVTSASDPLEAIAAFPDVTAAEAVLDDLKMFKTVIAPVRPTESDGITTPPPAPWDYSTRFYELSVANTKCVSKFGKNYAEARTRPDMLGATSKLYQDQS